MSNKWGDRLKGERVRLDLKQSEIVKNTPIGRTSQSAYEHSKGSPPVEYWQYLSEIGADIQYIITGYPSENPPILSTSEARVIDDKLMDTLELMRIKAGEGIVLIERKKYMGKARNKESVTE